MLNLIAVLSSLFLFAALCRDHLSSFRRLDVDVESEKIEWIVLIPDSLELGLDCGGIAGRTLSGMPAPLKFT
jgi:hypothetical protein